MEGICEVKHIDGEEWVIFYRDFNNELTPKILEFLSNYERVQFGWHFNKPVDNLHESLTHLKFGYLFNQPVDNLPNSITHLEFGMHFNKTSREFTELFNSS